MEDYTLSLELEFFVNKLANIQPPIRSELQAYKKAVIRMTIIEYMKEQEAVMMDAVARHG